MESPFLTTLRNETTSVSAFRRAADQLSHQLALEIHSRCEKREQPIWTPLAETTGTKCKNPTLIVPILRSGLAMLPPFLYYFSSASVGFMGIKRNEETKQPSLYYENLPKTSKEQEVIIIDPMLATGGTAILATESLIARGHPEKNITFAGIICSATGRKEYKSRFPDVKIVISQTDPELNDEMFILPGLGDFGDRYFSTPPEKCCEGKDL